ncbi:hypothetical protein ACHAWU_006882 [Discostella pseudostelligera]|uniref:Diacylglycerol O-acyltransferase n=1 Tax=Discostella pseudostelligera TaxID=259834 RepID=A0ABD3MXZ8_9STRA
MGEVLSSIMDMSSGEKRLQTLKLVGTLASVAVFSAVPLFFLALRNSAKRTSRRRRLSFTSVGLGIGTFPPETNAKEPIINAALYFSHDNGGCPSTQDVAQYIIKPLLEYERFSHVPDLHNHICRPSNHGNGNNNSKNNGEIQPLDLIREFTICSDDDLLLNQTIVSHLQDTLGAGRQDLPWWEILIIRNSGLGPSACVLRIHHVIGDGLALVAAFEKLLTNAEDGGVIRTPMNFKSGASSSTSTSENNNGNKKKKRGVLSTIWSLIEATGHCLTLSATKYDDDTVFSHMNNSQLRHSGKRSAIIFPTMPLEFIKQLKIAAGVTVNDILLTAVSQTIHDYCQFHNDAVLAKKGSAIQCRALLPVGFPRSTEELNDKYTAMRNLWCMVSCDIGVGHSDILDRMNHIHTKTTEMKERPRAYMQLKIQNGLGPFLPVSVGQKTVFDTFSRHSLVLTNVPGPVDTVCFAGKRVDSVQLFFDNLLTQVNLMSYAGKVYGNIIVDADKLPHSEMFGQLYVKALLELAKRLNVDVPRTAVFYFLMPLYSFWHMDDFSWGTTRQVSGATPAK